MTQYDMLPAESMTAVSLCPVVSEHTETERPLRISPHHPPLPPGRCNYLAGHGALHNKIKSQIITLWSCLKANHLNNNNRQGRKRHNDTAPILICGLFQVSSTYSILLL